MRTRRFEGTGAILTPRFTYWREIVAVLCLKAAGLALLYYFYFAPADRPIVTEQVVARHLLELPVSSMGEKVSHDR